MVLLVAALGIFTALQALIAMLFTSDFQTLSDFTPHTTNFTVGGAVITGVQVVILISTLVIAFGLAALLKFSRMGKAIKAVSDDEEVAKIVGINTNKIIAWVFVIGSAIAGWAGIMVGFDTGLQPTLGLSLLLKGVIAAIIGGIGSLWGGVLGALLLGLAENFGIWKIASEWKDAIAFIVLILFLVFRPNGILGRK
jgi:branched-chain amino acid transport system permease protein